MKCFNPYFKYEFGRGHLPFPCGCCPACRAQKAMEWTLRMYLESLYHNEVAFVTLTYDNEHLPEHNSLSPVDLQSFLKRLRRRLEYKIRYFACGEYGDKFGRAHYHLIIFGLKFEDYFKVYDAWQMGRVECEKPNLEAFKYVAGYVNKKIGRQKDWKLNHPNQYPMFQRASLGLGLRFILEKVPVFTNTLIVGDKHCYIGRYLRNKLADKLGILAEVKEDGLNMLQAETEVMLSEFYFNSDTKTLHEIEELERIFGVGAKMSLVWQKRYQGMIDHYIALMKLRQQNYHRGDYKNDITPTNQRIRRVFTGT